MTYRSNKQGGGGLVKYYESKLSVEMANNMVGWVRRPITKRLVSLNDQNHFICRLSKAILLLQASQVV